MESVRYLWRRDLVALVESHETCGNVAASMESQWIASEKVWQPPWSPTESVWWKRGSFHGVPWISQFWMRGWWECLDSWLRMQWCARSIIVTTAVVSVLISGRLRRMVKCLGKHFGSVYSWSTMSSSFVSCLSQCCNVESQRILSLFMHLHSSSSFSCHICLLRLVSSTCHPCLLDR